MRAMVRAISTTTTMKTPSRESEGVASEKGGVLILRNATGSSVCIWWFLLVLRSTPSKTTATKTATTKSTTSTLILPSITTTSALLSRELECQNLRQRQRYRPITRSSERSAEKSTRSWSLLRPAGGAAGLLPSRCCRALLDVRIGSGPTPSCTLRPHLHFRRKI